MRKESFCAGPKRPGRRARKVVAGALAMGILGLVSILTSHSPAQADTAAYELYCPGTPVGNIVINDVVTAGTLSPTNPSSGQPFSVTSYQTTLVIPNSIASAASALGNTDLTGMFTAQVDAQGASPSSIAEGPISFDVPIPSPVPANGMVISVPSSATSVGPLTASSSDITISQDTHTILSLNVSGSTLSMDCHAYKNHSLPSGISRTKPYGGRISPIIATVIEPLTITTQSLPGATAGHTYSSALAATGGNPPYSWKLAPGSILPRGLKIKRNTGDISGTPSLHDHGNYTFTVQVTDKRSKVTRMRHTATRAESITVG